MSPAHLARSLALIALCALSCKGNRIVGVGAQTDTFLQSGQDQQTETFNQRPGVIDILFVVDDSPNMCEKQQKLASNFSTFIAQLPANLDFHIGVVTSDNAQLVKDSNNDTFLTAQTANLSAAFAQMIAGVGSNGQPNAQPLAIAVQALSDPFKSNQNTGFLRDAASLAVIVVDDEDDYSASLPPSYLGYDAGTVDPMVGYFDRVFKSLKGPGQDGLITVSGIVGADPTLTTPTPAACTVPSGADLDGGVLPSCKYVFDAATPAFRILQIVSDTGGLGQSICQASFSTILTNLGQLLGGLTRQFAITSTGPAGQVFESSTLTVSVTPPGGTATAVPQSTTNGWSYDTSTQDIQFNGTAVPTQGATITVAFATLQSTFKLTDAPEISTLVVTVQPADGGVTTVPSSMTNPQTGYQYNATPSPEIVFPPNNLPPLGSTITATYNFLTMTPARSFRSPLIALALAIACGGGNSQSTGKCTTNGDCESGQFCNKAGSCQTDIGCASDSDCTNGQTCDTTSGACFCKTDAQCPSGQSCNAAGKCQGQSYCASNIDCTTSGFFCDTQSHACIAQGTCLQDLQCPQGQICNTTTKQCVTGCQVDGDCVLLDYTKTPPAYLPVACIDMQCVPNACHSTLNCGVYGVCLSSNNGLCGLNDNTCTCQTVCGDTQFCTSCDPTQQTPCAHNGYCLDDPANDANCDPTHPSSSCHYFCGIDCSNGEVCPAGTICYAITEVSDQGTDGPGEVCNVGDTCTGKMNTPCPVVEGQQSAACPCYQDSDCPLNPATFSNFSCDVASGSCISGAQCAFTKQYTCATNSCGSG